MKGSVSTSQGKLLLHSGSAANAAALKWLTCSAIQQLTLSRSTFRLTRNACGSALFPLRMPGSSWKEGSSADERKAFFHVLDEDLPHISHPYAWRMWNEYKLIFRLLYSCGMRNSEACCLKNEDVDIGRKTLMVRHSKGDKDRLIYLADDMAELMTLYQKYIFNTLGYMPVWFFPSRDPAKHVHKTTIDHRFNQVWGRTPYASLCSKKPTVHCLRHSFVVDRMNAWIDEGLVYEQMLPYLSKYLGHSGIEESLYYYHLNEEAP